MDQLTELLSELQSKIPKAEIINNKVSSASAGWHIEHILLSLNFITDGLKKSDPKEYKWKFSFPRILVFTLKKIPRGRGKSPEIVQPKNNITADSLRQKLMDTSEKIKELDHLKPDSFIRHPYFGDLNLKKTKKFLLIHTRHHIDIINDILKN